MQEKTESLDKLEREIKIVENEKTVLKVANEVRDQKIASLEVIHKLHPKVLIWQPGRSQRLEFRLERGRGENL